LDCVVLIKIKHNFFSFLKPVSTIKNKTIQILTHTKNLKKFLKCKTIAIA
jgi:hypothetical protein